MRRAHGEGGERVLCTFCGQGFSTMRLARQHEVQHHGAGSVPVEAKARYQCPECPQSFTLKGHLKRHLHLHTDALPFICDLCGKAFKWKEVLKRHMLSHGEKTIRESSILAEDKDFACVDLNYVQGLAKLRFL